MIALTCTAVALGLVALLSLPHWLPRCVAKLRNSLFARVNGPEGLHLPNAAIGPAETMRIYKHDQASGRAAGASLSDLFWYWMAPGPQYHQENMEAGPAYELTRRTTRKLLAVKPGAMHSLAAKSVQQYLLRPLPAAGWRQVQLTRWFFPMFAALYYELLFGREATAAEVGLLVAHADNFLGALKGNEMRQMGVRSEATDVLRHAITATPRERFDPLASAYSEEELALYLQGNFFSTGVVQMSEAMAHMLLALAQHPAAAERLLNDQAPEAYAQSVMKEAFRLYPLFGISHRILQGDIPLDDGGVLAAGSVICLDHEAYNRAVYDRAEEFLPERWYAKELAKIAIPFGAKENRSCPAEGFVVNLSAFMLPLLARELTFASTAEHQRSLANMAPAIVIRRGIKIRGLALRLWLMRQRDAWSRVALSLKQLVYGTWMVIQARDMRLCAAYFADQAGVPADRLSVACQSVGATSVETYCAQ